LIGRAVLLVGILLVECAVPAHAAPDDVLVPVLTASGEIGLANLSATDLSAGGVVVVTARGARVHPARELTVFPLVVVLRQVGGTRSLLDLSSGLEVPLAPAEQGLLDRPAATTGRPPSALSALGVRSLKATARGRPRRRALRAYAGVIALCPDGGPEVANEALGERRELLERAAEARRRAAVLCGVSVGAPDDPEGGRRPPAGPAGPLPAR
jgi:hypothetical protein